MSNYLRLRCTSHTPPLVAESESGQHDYDLPQIREDVAQRDAILAGLSAGMGFDLDHERYRNNTARFLRDHPGCKLDVEDEHGDIHSLDPDQTEENSHG